MNIYQFFDLMKLLGDYALDNNRSLYKITDCTTIREYFTCYAPVQTDDIIIQPGYYMWIWADDMTDKDVIEDMLAIYFPQGENIIATWRQFDILTRYNYIVKIEQD